VQRAPASCISTYVKSTRTTQKMLHHWVEGNTQGKCSKCKKQIKSYNGITGLHCRWCHLTVRKTCFHTLTKTHRASSLTGANLTSYSRTASQPVRFPRLSRVHPWPKPRAYPATHGHLSDCLGQAEVGSCIIASLSLSLSPLAFSYIIHNTNTFMVRSSAVSACLEKRT